MDEILKVEEIAGIEWSKDHTVARTSNIEAARQLQKLLTDEDGCRELLSAEYNAERGVYVFTYAVIGDFTHFEQADDFVYLYLFLNTDEGIEYHVFDPNDPETEYVRCATLEEAQAARDKLGALRYIIKPHLG